MTRPTSRFGSTGSAAALAALVCLGAGAAAAAPAVRALAPLQNGIEAGEPLESPEHMPYLRVDKPRVTAPQAALPAVQTPLGLATTVQVNVAQNGANILGDAANEPSLVVNPLRPLQLAVGWRQFDSVGSDFRQAGWGYSTNGGRTWRFPGVLEPGVFRSDPVLGADKNGNLYYSSLKGDFSIDFFTSSNGGATWLGTFPAYGGDKQWIAVDRTNSIGSGNIYQSWSTAAGCCGTAIFNRGTLNGASWTFPVTVPLSPRWGTLVVDNDGTLFLAGIDSQSRFVVAKSTTVKNNAFLPGFDGTVLVNLGGTIGVGQGIGSPNPVGLLGQVWIGYDASEGPFAGSLYLACSVDPPGADPMDVMFAASRDGGATWSPPVRVNDVTTGWQWNATMGVAPNGRIDIAWNDTRDTGLANESRLYTSSSFDGGQNWSTNVALTPAWNSHAGFPVQQKIGDYAQMQSDLTGFSMAWAATFNGEQDVWLTRVGELDCNGDGVGDETGLAAGIGHDANANGLLDECEGLQASDAAPVHPAWALEQNVPNPFNPTTRIGYVAPPEGGAVRLEIFGIAGRRVRTMTATAGPGRHEFVWDGTDDAGISMPSGVYLYRLHAGGVTATRRMALVR